MELPKEQCPFCVELLAKYRDILGYTKEDLEKMLPRYAPRKSWIAKSTKGGSQMMTHYFQCKYCYPLTKKGWRRVERRFNQKELYVSEIGARARSLAIKNLTEEKKEVSRLISEREVFERARKEKDKK